MKREFVFGTLLAAALGVGTAAQGTAPQTTTQSDKERPTVTITGCLVPGSQGAVGTSGTTAGTAATSTTAGATAASATAAGGFMLINAKEGSGPDPAAATTTGTSGTTIGGTAGASRSDEGKSFILIGGDQTDLQRFVNSRVEIQGSIEPAAYNAPATTTTTMTGTAGQTAEKKPPQRLRVTSVRQVADSCSGGQ